MTATEFITLLYRKVCLREELPESDQTLIHSWCQRSKANNQVYHRLVNHPANPIHFKDRYRFIVLLLWSLIAIVIGLSLGILLEKNLSHQAKATSAVNSHIQDSTILEKRREMGGQKSSLEVRLPTEVWDAVSEYALERNMTVGWNGLGKLTFRLPPDTLLIAQAPLDVKRTKIDSLANTIVRDLCGEGGGFISMAVAVISIKNDYATNIASGFSDYEGTYNYNVGDFYLNGKFRGVPANKSPFKNMY